MITKKQLQNLRLEVFSDENKGSSHALEDLKTWSQKVEKLVKSLLQQQFRRYKLSDQCAVVALGGFGREELHPYSDIDLLILMDIEMDDSLLGMALQPLWDTGLKLGLVTRTIHDCQMVLGLELATDLALYERRFCFGKRSLYDELETKVLTPYFSRERKRLQQRLLSDLKGSVLSDRSGIHKIEPHLKTGMGALRDAHRVRWVCELGGEGLSILGDDRLKFEEAVHFIAELRTHLHMLNKRRMDILEIDSQEKCAELMGGRHIGPAFVLQEFFKHAHVIRQCALVLVEHFDEPVRWLKGIKKLLGGMTLELGVELVGGWINPGSKTPEEPSALWMMDLFCRTALYKVGLGVSMVNFLRRRCDNMGRQDFTSDEIGAMFKHFLDGKHDIGPVLFSMYETGFLEKMCPEFAPLKAKVQFTSFHEYTVDHHTLLCVQSVDDLLKENSENGKLCLQLPRLWLLRLGLLLHDIGKGMDGVHEVTGQVLAQNFCKRLGYSNEEIDIVNFLVYRHMNLSQLAFRREADDEMILQSAKTIGTVERCQLLYLLTVLDVKNVGNNTWTTWKGVLLNDVYHRCLGAIHSSHQEGETVVPASKVLSSIGDTPQEILTVWEGLKQRWRDTQEPQFKLVRYGDVDEITTVFKDRVGLCADMLACITSEGYELLHAILNESDQGAAVSVWYVTHNEDKMIQSTQKVQKIKQKWIRLEAGEVTAQSIVMEHLRLYPSKASRDDLVEHDIKISWRDDMSEGVTVCEIFAKSRPGLLYRCARVFAKHGVDVQGAKISTVVENAEDVFYLKKDGGSFKVDESSSLHLELLDALKNF